LGSNQRPDGDILLAKAKALANWYYPETSCDPAGEPDNTKIITVRDAAVLLADIFGIYCLISALEQVVNGILLHYGYYKPYSYSIEFCIIWAGESLSWGGCPCEQKGTGKLVLPEAGPQVHGGRDRGQE